MTYCENNSLVLYKNYPSRFMSVNWLEIKFDTEFDLSGFSAKFKLGTHEQTWNTLVDGVIINLTAQETALLPEGLNYASLVVWDNEGNSKPFTTAIPVDVRVWVEGQYQKIDTYHNTVNAKFEGETVMTITIETAQVSEQMVDDKIAEHNESVEAHPYIQNLIEEEAQTRAIDDASLGQSIAQETQDRISDVASLDADIQTKQPKLTSTNAGENITITEVGGVVKINSEGGGVTIHNQLTGRDAENTHPMSSITGLNTALSGKQPTISDLDTIRAGADLGGTSLQPNDIINNTTSTSTNKVLSAAMGKSLQDQVDNLNARGKYLSIWDCTTGLAMDEPPVNPYQIETGSYFIVGKVASAGGVNYRPNGGVYDKDVPSRVVETEEVKLNATYYWDGTQWRLVEAQDKDVSFSSLAGSPYDNTNLASALNSKQDEIDDLDDIRSGASAGATALQSGDNVSELNNDAGYLTGITGTQVTNALGYTPYNSTNPNGYQTVQQVENAITSKGYATETYVNNHHDTTKQDKITSTNKLSYSLISGTPTNVSTFTNDAGYLTLSTLPIWNGGVIDVNS